MSKTSILAIAPDQGIAELLNQIAQSRNDIEITIRIGNLAEGVMIARSMLQHNNYDVVISRGGTTELLRSSLNCTVIEIPISAYDVLRCIKMAQSYSGRFAIVGFCSITNTAKTLCELLQIDTRIITFKDKEDALPILKKIKEEGYSLVVCDRIGQTTAQEIGLNSIFIPSGKESIEQAIDDAIGTVQKSAFIRLQKEIFRKAITIQNSSTMIYDAQGTLIFSSVLIPAVESKINTMYKNTISTNKSNVEYYSIRKIADRTYKIIWNLAQVEDQDYTFIQITEKKNLLSNDDQTIRIFNNIQELSESENSIGNNSANLVGEGHLMTEKYALTNYPIVITGETGTGKTKVAELIYARSAFHAHPYYVINCRFLNDEKWKQLLNNETSPLFENAVTINFIDMQLLDEKKIHELYKYIQYSNLLKRSRIIFSLLLPDKRATDIAHTLINQFSCLLLALSPLRDRVQDIPSISTIYVNQVNNTLGKQVVGFQEAAMKILQQFSWPDNLNQFHRVIKELVIISKGSYITEDEVKSVLAQEMMKSTGLSSMPGEFPINLNQTMDKIERDIVSYILTQENISKEAAAKRLGISRTTLWRLMRAD